MARPLHALRRCVSYSSSPSFPWTSSPFDPFSPRAALISFSPASSAAPTMSPASDHCNTAAPAMTPSRKSRVAGDRRWWSRQWCAVRGRGSSSSSSRFTTRPHQQQRWREADYEKMRRSGGGRWCVWRGWIHSVGAPARRVRWRVVVRKLQARLRRWMRKWDSCVIVAGSQDRTLDVDLLYDPVSYALNFDEASHTPPPLSSSSLL